MLGVDLPQLTRHLPWQNNNVRHGLDELNLQGEAAIAERVISAFSLSTLLCSGMAHLVWLIC